MLETRATVVFLDGDEAVVATKHGGCGNCDNVNGCGSGKLAKLFCLKPRQFRVRNEVNACVGEEIQVTVADGVLLRSAAVLYLLPLALLLTGALLGSFYAADAASRDSYAATGALVGLIAGFTLARLVTLQQRSPAVASKSFPE